MERDFQDFQLNSFSDNHKDYQKALYLARCLQPPGVLPKTDPLLDVPHNFTKGQKQGSLSRRSQEVAGTLFSGVLPGTGIHDLFDSTEG